MKYRLIIFDSDGTLADTLPRMRSIFNELAEEHGFKRVEPSEYHRFRDLHGAALLRELGLPLWKMPRTVTPPPNDSPFQSNLKRFFKGFIAAHCLTG